MMKHCQVSGLHTHLQSTNTTRSETSVTKKYSETNRTIIVFVQKNIYGNINILEVMIDSS